MSGQQATAPGRDSAGGIVAIPFFPYFEGLSERAYSREKLREYETAKVNYNGQEMSVYEASQQQRYIERQIRRWKREYMAMDAAGADTTEASVKLRMEGKAEGFSESNRT